MPGLAALRALSLGNRNVRLALLDGPAALDHPCFAGASVQQVSGAWLSDTPPADWAVQHATGIASIVVGQPGTSVEGIAPGIHVINVVSVSEESSTPLELTLARAIEAALTLGPDIIHMAQCIPSQTSTIGDLLARALHQASAAGVLLVAPAGNNSGSSFCAPADQPAVLAVGGLDDDGSVRDRSNRGHAYDGHGVMAWSENLLVATPDGKTKREAGTSGAAPQVSATAALLLSIARNAGLDPTPAEVGRIIRTTARALTDPVDRERAIGGVLDPEAALHALLGDRAPAGVAPSSDGPGKPAAGAGVAPSLRLPCRVFALGRLDVDLSDRARRDRLAERMAEAGIAPSGACPEDVPALTVHLQSSPQDSTLLTWILRTDEAATYAIRPAGPHANRVTDRLIELLAAGSGAADGTPVIERGSVPGVMRSETVQIHGGSVVPVVDVARPGLISGWRTLDLARLAATTVLGPRATPADANVVAGLLDRIYDGHRNHGVLGRDRALNYAGTNVVQAATAVLSARELGLDLESLSVHKSRFGRPFSECWDIHASFVDPESSRRARRVWIWTVDVADDAPVGVGVARTWATA